MRQALHLYIALPTTSLNTVEEKPIVGAICGHGWYAEDGVINTVKASLGPPSNQLMITVVR